MATFFRWILFFPISFFISVAIGLLFLPAKILATTQLQSWYIEWYFFFLSGYLFIMLGSLIAPKGRFYISIFLYCFSWLFVLANFKHKELSTVIIQIASTIYFINIPILFWIWRKEDSDKPIVFIAPMWFFCLIGGIFSVFVNFYFIYSDAGFGLFGIIVAFFIIPFTLAFAPLYAAIGFDYYFPLFVTYGSIGLGVVYFKLIKYVLEDEL